MSLWCREMTQEDAHNYLVRWLRNQQPSIYPSYGYDVYLPSIMIEYTLRESRNNRYIRVQGNQWDANAIADVSPYFYSAAWELCRRGILRPGVARFGEQNTPDGSAGNGYSITPFGRIWLEESNRDDYVPTEPERFAQLLSPYEARFGAGFHERAQQAIRCYGAHAYLACCAMCGAAAESIMLALAIAKVQNEESVLRDYKKANGRNAIEQKIIGMAGQSLKIDFLAFTGLLKYWRDESAHGRVSRIAETEAFTSLALLLRFAQWAYDHWDELIVQPNLSN
jgi:hypothetical protein